jgi:hypothetical protein
MRLIIGTLVSLACVAAPAGRAAVDWAQPRAASVLWRGGLRPVDADALRPLAPSAAGVRPFFARALGGTGLPIVLDGAATQDLFDPDP